jgi:hypothetical protein
MLRQRKKTRSARPRRTTLRNRADALWSKVIRLRDGECQAQRVHGIICSGTLQGAHLIPRRYMSVRFDEGNGVALCGAHHTYFTHFPLEWADWIERRLDPKLWRDLRAIAMAARGGSDYEAIIERLAGRLDELERARGLK